MFLTIWISNQEDLNSAHNQVIHEINSSISLSLAENISVWTVPVHQCQMLLYANDSAEQWVCMQISWLLTHMAAFNPDLTLKTAQAQQSDEALVLALPPASQGGRVSPVNLSVTTSVFHCPAVRIWK